MSLIGGSESKDSTSTDWDLCESIQAEPLQTNLVSRRGQWQEAIICITLECMWEVMSLLWILEVQSAWSGIVTLTKILHLDWDQPKDQRQLHIIP